MARFARWYGAPVSHLVALVVGGAVSAYAVTRLGSLDTLVAVGIWFAGTLVVHDLVLFPLYAAADAVSGWAARRLTPAPAVPWRNHVRFPAVWSGILMLAWFPLVLRVSSGYRAASGRSPAPYLWHWLLVTAALFGGSLVVYVIRRRSWSRSRSRSPSRRGPPGSPRPTS